MNHCHGRSHEVTQSYSQHLAGRLLLGTADWGKKQIDVIAGVDLMDHDWNKNVKITVAHFVSTV